MKKQYNTIKISAQQLQTANMICASIQSGLTGGNGTGIGNGGNTSGGSSSGFDGVDARGNNGSTFDMDI